MPSSPLRLTQSPRQSTTTENRSRPRNAPRKSAVRATPQVFASPSQVLADPTEQAQTASAGTAGRPSLSGAPDDHTRKKRRVTFSRRQELTDYDREEPTVNIRPASEMPMPDTPSTQSNLTHSSVESESMSMDMSMTGIYNQTPISAHSSHRASSSFASPGSSMSISGYRLSSPRRPSMGRSSVGSARSSAYDDDEDSEEDDDAEDQSMSMDMSMTNVQNPIRPRSSMSLYHSRQSLDAQESTSSRSRPSASFNQSRQSLGDYQAELSRQSFAETASNRSRRSSVAPPVQIATQVPEEVSARTRYSLVQEVDRPRLSGTPLSTNHARTSLSVQQSDADLSRASSYLPPQPATAAINAEQNDESDDSEADVELQLQDTTVEMQKRARMEAIQACDQEVLADLHEAIDEQASVLNDYRQKRQRANDQLERIQARLNEVLGQKQVLLEAITSARDVYQSIQASTGGKAKIGSGGSLESARLLHGFEKKIPGLHRWTINLRPSAQRTKRVAGVSVPLVEMVYDSVLILHATLDRNSAATHAAETGKGGRRSSSAVSAMSRLPMLRHAQVQLAREAPVGSAGVIQDFAVDVLNDTLQQVTAAACSTAVVMRIVSHIWQRQTHVQGEFALLQARRPTEVIRIETTGVPVSLDDSAANRDVNNQALMLSSTMVLKRLRAKIRFHVGCSADMFAGMRVGEGAELEYLDGPAGWEAHTAVIEGVYGDVDSEAMMNQAIECLERSSGQVGPYARLVHSCETLSAIYDVLT